MTRAELLRRLQPGVKLRLVYRSSDGPKNMPREVISATRTTVVMRGPDYPRTSVSLAGATIQTTPAGFEIAWPGASRSGALLRYEWVPSAGEQLELR